jgi:hypothetical protein
MRRQDAAPFSGLSLKFFFRWIVSFKSCLTAEFSTVEFSTNQKIGRVFKIKTRGKRLEKCILTNLDENLLLSTISKTYFLLKYPSKTALSIESVFQKPDLLFLFCNLEWLHHKELARFKFYRCVLLENLCYSFNSFVHSSNHAMV